jgi:hypothetical protein
MAYSAGSIAFSGLPNQYTVITINDGQSAAYSTLKLGVQVNDSSLSSIFVSGTAASNNTVDGNASELVTVYQQGNTSRRPFFDFSLADGGASFADWKAAFKNDGTAPAKLQFKQPGFGGFTIDFVDLASGFTATSGLGSYGRDNGTGDYSINLNSITNLSNTMNTIKSIFTAANTAGEADFYTSQLTVSSNYLRVMDDRATSAANVLSLALVPSGSASWTDAGVVAWKVGTDRGNNNMASVQTANEAVYAARGASGDSSSTLTTAQFATYIGALINNLPIQITATVSDGTVSLTNDVEGTDGNVTITTTDATNITLSGMSGGASSGGDTVAKRLQISARQIALSGSGGLSGSADGKSALMLDLAGLSALTAVAQADSFAFQDATDSKPKSITFGNLEDAIFANVTTAAGDVTIAAGGAATIVADAVEGSMLNDNVISGQTELAHADIADADELMISDGGLLKKVGLDSLQNHYFAAISGDATVADGGALTIAANAVQTGMVHDDVATELGGTGLTATSGVLAVDASQTQVTALGTIATGVWQGTVIDSAYLDADTAHLTTAQTFSGAKTFSALASLDGGVDVNGNLTISTAGAVAGATTISGSGELAVGTIAMAEFTVARNGNTDIDGTLNVEGVPTFQAAAVFSGGITTANAIAGATSIDGSGDLTMGTITMSGFSVDADGDVGAKDLTLTGNLVVGGTTTTVNSTVVAIADKAMVFASGSSNASIASAGGAGVAIGKDAGTSGSLASLLYDGVDSWDVSDHLNLASSQEFKINNASVLSATTLGSSVVGSSLTSVGTIAAGVWQGTAVARAYIAADAIDGTKIADDAVDSEHFAAGSIDLEHMSANSVDSDQYVDGSIDLIHMSANSVDSDQYVDGSIDRVHLSADVIDGTKIEDDAVDSEHIAAGAIDLAHMSANSVDSDQYVDGSIDTAHIADNQVTLAKMAGIARGSIISGDASGDPQALALGAANRFFQSDGTDAAWVAMSGDATLSAGVLTLSADSVDSAEIASGAIDLDHMSANSVDSDQYVDGSIDLVHMSANSVDSDQYVDGSIDTAHLGDDQVTGAKLNSDIKGDGIQMTSAGVLSITHSEVRETGTACAASAVLFGSGGAYDELTNAPASAAAVSVYFNGIMQSQGTDYTISGSTITLGSGNSIAAEDEVIVKYINQ